MNLIPLKTTRQIKTIKLICGQLGKIRQKLFEFTQPGVTGQEVEDLAQKLIKSAGGEASFAKVPGYRWATCININQGIVHGVPNQYRFKKGDLVSIDVGLFKNGWHSDCSATQVCGYPNLDDYPHQKLANFLKAGKQTLNLAISKAQVGNRVGHISQTIEKTLNQSGYRPIPNLTGHGIGKKLHEPPQIPGITPKKVSDTPVLRAGMTLAIEVIYTLGNGKTQVSSDDRWTVTTKDGKMAAIFEETIAVLDDGPLILTRI